jgi:tRNA-binding EMAP/Myf-like protein
MLEGNFFFLLFYQHPESENLYCENIDIGGEVREVASGL